MVSAKLSKKYLKNLGFHLMFKTADLQDIIYTSMDDDIIVSFNSLYPYIPNLIPSVETQLLFNEASQNIYNDIFRQMVYRKTINIRFISSARYRIGTTSE